MEPGLDSQAQHEVPPIIYLLVFDLWALVTASRIAVVSTP